MTRNAPADFPREIPNLAVGSWLARIGPRSRTWAPPARRRRQVVGWLPGCRRRRVWRRGQSVCRVGSTGLAVDRENGSRQQSDHEHRRARLALLPRTDGSEAARPRQTRSPHASAHPTRSARRGHRSRKLRWSARCGPGGCLDHLAARPALDGDIPDAVAF